KNVNTKIQVAGGLTLDEHAIDLAVGISIASSFKNEPTSREDIDIGEVVLTGEIRRVSRIEQRVKATAKLAVKRIICSKSKLDGRNPTKRNEEVNRKKQRAALNR